MRFAAVRLLTEIRSLRACRRGQVAIIFAFAATMLFVSIGMGIDLWRAYAVKARLQSAVDAAALALASTDRTPYPNPQDPFLVSRVEAYVSTNYPSSALGTPGVPVLSYGGTNLNTIIVTDGASVPTTFMNIIGVNSLSVSATGQAQAAWSNIDFYLLLDSSPSMGIAATAAGISTMVANTLQECDSPPAGAGNTTCGCGFACHETNPQNETQCSPAWSSTAPYAIGNYVYISNNTYEAVRANTNHSPPNTTYWSAKGGGCPQPGLGNAGGVDNYQLAQNLGVTLRLDDLKTAVAQMMTTAQNTETTYNLTNAFRMAIYTFDVNFNNGVAPGGPIIQALTSDLTTAASSAANIQQLEMCQNNSTLINGSCTSNSDADTNYTAAMTGINTIMPDPGQGTQAPGDTPKEVLMLVTDGVEDENVSSCTTSGGSPAGTNSPYVVCSGNRRQSVMSASQCTTIKNRGILVAVLYLEYDPLPTNRWYNNNVSPYNQPPPPTGIPPTTPTPIETALQNCSSSVSTGPLYAKVVEGGDISAALSNLFSQAVNAVYLSR